jgi:hypothetical protein
VTDALRLVVVGGSDAGISAGRGSHQPQPFITTTKELA